MAKWNSILYNYTYHEMLWIRVPKYFWLDLTQLMHPFAWLLVNVMMWLAWKPSNSLAHPLPGCEQSTTLQPIQYMYISRVQYLNPIYQHILKNKVWFFNSVHYKYKWTIVFSNPMYCIQVHEQGDIWIMLEIEAANVYVAKMDSCPKKL